jgi:hypothetical protein
VPFRDANSTIVKWYVSSIDIDDRMQAGERIRQQERELREILDLVPHHILVSAPTAPGSMRTASCSPLAPMVVRLRRERM